MQKTISDWFTSKEHKQNVSKNGSRIGFHQKNVSKNSFSQRGKLENGDWQKGTRDPRILCFQQQIESIHGIMKREAKMNTSPRMYSTGRG